MYTATLVISYSPATLHSSRVPAASSLPASFPLLLRSPPPRNISKPYAPQTTISKFPRHNNPITTANDPQPGSSHPQMLYLHTFPHFPTTPPSATATDKKKSGENSRRNQELAPATRKERNGDLNPKPNRQHLQAYIPLPPPTKPRKDKDSPIPSIRRPTPPSLSPHLSPHPRPQTRNKRTHTTHRKDRHRPDHALVLRRRQLRPRPAEGAARRGRRLRMDAGGGAGGGGFGWHGGGWRRDGGRKAGMVGVVEEKKENGVGGLKGGVFWV